MKEKDFSLCLLYDIYSPLFSEKKREVFEMSYHEDMSLAEIAEITGTSRQGVRELLARARDELYELEEKLGLKKQLDIKEENRKKLFEIAEKIKDTHKSESDEIIRIISAKGE